MGKWQDIHNAQTFNKKKSSEWVAGGQAVRTERPKADRQRLPICPYGCGEEGQLKEVIMQDGKAIGIFNDSDGCVFQAFIEIGEPPTKKKLIIGPDGQLKETE
jgi:hypothetical protein